MRPSCRLLAAVTLAFALLHFTAVPAFSEKLDFEDTDFQFIDARDYTGYYLDMNSVNIDGEEAFATVKIVRADRNRLYLYSVKFVRKERTYQILSSIAADYDTKEKTGGSRDALRPLHYENGSPMEAVVEYIYFPRR